MAHGKRNIPVESFQLKSQLNILLIKKNMEIAKEKIKKIKSVEQVKNNI